MNQKTDLGKKFNKHEINFVGRLIENGGIYLSSNDGNLYLLDLKRIGNRSHIFKPYVQRLAPEIEGLNYKVIETKHNHRRSVVFSPKPQEVLSQIPGTDLEGCVAIETEPFSFRQTGSYNLAKNKIYYKE
ncbi:hypothetical protein HQ489_02090 [Candidatus Woesearchaeota archaeon]|nr:hypothetical protein [Candidatus Woesearchaeota archaeon]